VRDGVDAQAPPMSTVPATRVMVASAVVNLWMSAVVGYLRRSGHHALDARSVLDPVQGSMLRIARAYARPAGLDGACASIAGRQLRDGRRLAPFETAISRNLS
jgi:hypothetical protein